jgi:hypothetical protein
MIVFPLVLALDVFAITAIMIVMMQQRQHTSLPMDILFLLDKIAIPVSDIAVLFVVFVSSFVPVGTAIVIGGLLEYFGTVSRKGFMFYFARTCFLNALNKKDIFEQMFYFNLGLQAYNKCLKRLKYQIKDIDKIFSKMSMLDNDAKNDVIRSLSSNFETETDKLRPLKCISSELIKSEDTESILIKETVRSRLKGVGTFLSAAIPIVISIITLILTKPKF